MGCLVALVLQSLLVGLEDGPSVDAPEEALDDAKRDKAPDVDAERVDLVILLPVVDRQTGSKAGIEAAEGRPFDWVAIG